MSRHLTQKEDGTYLEEIESMEVCKWKINEVCCNDKSDCVGDYPYPYNMCEIDKNGENWICGCFEKEDGIINKQKE